MDKQKCTSGALYKSKMQKILFVMVRAWIKHPKNPKLENNKVQIGILTWPCCLCISCQRWQVKNGIFWPSGCNFIKPYISNSNKITTKDRLCWQQWQLLEGKAWSHQMSFTVNSHPSYPCQLLHRTVIKCSKGLEAFLYILQQSMGVQSRKRPASTQWSLYGTAAYRLMANPSICQS